MKSCLTVFISSVVGGALSAITTYVYVMTSTAHMHGPEGNISQGYALIFFVPAAAIVGVIIGAIVGIVISSREP